MKHITFERVMLCVIAAGVWTIAILCMGAKDVNVINKHLNSYVYGEVEVTNDVDVNVISY